MEWDKMGRRGQWAREYFFLADAGGFYFFYSLHFNLTQLCGLSKEKGKGKGDGLVNLFFH
jgi:hypothetical protein